MSRVLVHQRPSKKGDANFGFKAGLARMSEDRALNGYISASGAIRIDAVSLHITLEMPGQLPSSPFATKPWPKPLDHGLNYNPNRYAIPYSLEAPVVSYQPVDRSQRNIILLFRCQRVYLAQATDVFV